MAFDPRKSVRIIAFNAQNVHHIKTANISTVQNTGGAANHPHREFLQLTAAQAVKGVHPTIMDSGGTVKGLPTLYVAGYGGPN
jgi:hypothetical protein